MLKEFKAFISKGNVLDLAIGVIIGAAFGKIVSSLVNDVIMPIIGLILGNINFKELKIILKEANNDIPASTLNYGLFIQNIIDFLIIAFIIFLFVKLYSKTKKEDKKEPKQEVPTLTKDQELLIEIRDLLKNKVDWLNEGEYIC